MITLLTISASFAAGWFSHRYREKFLRIKGRVKSVLDEELK